MLKVNFMSDSEVARYQFKNWIMKAIENTFGLFTKNRGEKYVSSCVVG